MIKTDRKRTRKKTERERSRKKRKRKKKDFSQYFVLLKTVIFIIFIKLPSRKPQEFCPSNVRKRRSQTQLTWRVSESPRSFIRIFNSGDLLLIETLL